MTPFEIRVLLHYFTTTGEPPERQAPIYSETIQQFINDELLARHPSGGVYILPRGEAYCEALQRVRLPVQKWVMP